MTTSPPQSDTVEPGVETAARMWGSNMRWARWVFPTFWLIYLGQTLEGVSQHSDGVAAVAGWLIVVAFAATYVAALPMGRAGHNTWFWWLYGLSFALTAIECVFAHEDALIFCVYIGVLTMATRRNWAFGVVVAMAAACVALPRLLWHDDLGWGIGLPVLLAAIAMWGFFNVIRSNLALSAARAEVARLAAENERSRIARDLHDLLGHSLTTITVKAGLARRLGERGEVERALAEISEVEALTRRTLGDVRAAVAGHRNVTLVGEIATAREVLRAAAIISELPGSVDVVDPALSELFGWVVREGITNVVRHARATHVRVVLGKRSVEIADDGRGGTPGAGNGLTGLRERVEAADGTLVATGGLAGFKLRVEVPAHIPAVVEA